MGKRIIETRVLIKNNGIWEVGNYLWNDQQTEAVLDGNRHILNVSWTDTAGVQRNAGYTVPSTNDCISCHSKNGTNQPIGPKARALYSASGSSNQLLQWINSGILQEVAALGGVDPLPNAWDLSYSLEERARAYMDVNCAHCHQPGSVSYSGSLDLRFETPFAQTAIEALAADIQFRMTTSISSLKMPQIGTSIPHDEGIDLINAYIDSLN
jgi:mono/diheme cytochrome c family protein